LGAHLQRGLVPARLRTLIIAMVCTAACPSPPKAAVIDAGVPVADVLPALVVDAGTHLAPALTLGAPDDSTLWEAMRVRAGAASVDALRSCASSDQCTTLFHFTRCCDHLSVNAKHASVLHKAGASLTREHQTADQLRMCQIVSCSGVLPPSTCAAGRCVVDGERAMWIDVARVTSTANVDALRACNMNDDCAIVPHPTRCCQPAAVARAFVDAARKAVSTLMPPDEARKCAIKDCAIRGEPVCVEGLCRVAH
jgi:hypothetical protein